MGGSRGLKSRLDGIYSGEPYPIAADRAVAAVVAERTLPRELWTRC